MAGTTGFEPATSGLTGRRELQASPRPRGPEAVHLGHPLRLRGLGEYRAGGLPASPWNSEDDLPHLIALAEPGKSIGETIERKNLSTGTLTRPEPTISVTSANSVWSNMVDPMISSCL